MKKKLLKLLIGMALVTALSTGVAACKDNQKTPPVNSSSASSLVQSLKIDFTALTLDVFDTIRLNVEDAKGEVSWSSSNPSVATVTQDGIVTALASGNVEIIATAGGETVSCRITVRNEGIVPMLEFANDDFAIFATATLTIGAKVSFKGETLPCAITYETMNSAVATVDTNGVVTGVAAGETVINVTAVVNANLILSDSVRVTVRNITD